MKKITWLGVKEYEDTDVCQKAHGNEGFISVLCAMITDNSQ